MILPAAPMGLLALIQAEGLKLRRSLILGLALIFPMGFITVAILVGFMVITPGDHATWRGWMSFALIPWTSLLLPMQVCLLSTLLMNLEHQNHQWKHLHALPVRRWKHLATKQTVLALLLLLGHLLLLVGFYLGGWVLKLARPTLHLESPRLLLAASLLGLIFLASWAMAAAHTWLAARFPNLAVNLGMGLAGVMLIGAVSQRPAMARAFPWAMPSKGLFDWMGGPEAGSPWLVVGLSLGIGTILLALACWDAQRRDSVD